MAAHPKLVATFAGGEFATAKTFTVTTGGAPYSAVFAAHDYSWAVLGDGGTYDILDEIADDLTAAIGIGTFTATVGATGLVTLTYSAAQFQVNWATDDNTAIGQMLGFDTGTNLAGAASYTGGDQHRGGWYPEFPTADDSGEYSAHNVVVCHAPSSAWVLKDGTSPTWRELTFELIRGWKCVATTGYENEDFAGQIFDRLAQGSRIYYFPDRATTTGEAGPYVVRDGEFFADLWAALPRARRSGNIRGPLTLRLRKVS